MTDPRDLSTLSPEQKRALLAELLAQRASQNPARWPLSHGQRALWFLHQMNPGSAAYNIAFAVRIGSALDLAALDSAIQGIARRHAVLRCTFEPDERGDPWQYVAPQSPLGIAVVDASALDDDALRDTVISHHRQPFDLGRGPLLRVTVFTRGARDHVLLISVHHIVFDGWSVGIFVEEMWRLYREALAGVPAELQPVEFQYGDFVDWQRRMLDGPEGAQLETYWTGRLPAPLPLIELPADHQRPRVLGADGEAFDFVLPADVMTELEAIGRREHTSVFVTLLASFEILLSRYAGQEQILVGAPTAGRTRAEFERIIGYFVNPIVLVGDLGGNPTFAEHLQRVRDTVQGALAHQDYPFPLLVERLHPQRDPSRSPVFQVMFNLQKASRLFAGSVNASTGSNNGGPELLQMSPYPIPQEEGQFDLSLDALETGSSIACTLRYNTDLFEHATIARMAAHFTALLRSIGASPSRPIGELSLLGADERQQLAAWNPPPDDKPATPVIDLIEAHCERSPDAIAVTCAGRSLTYSQLNARANQLAWTLRELGVGRDALVGIGVDRSLEMLVAVLAVLKAGGAYVPLDPAFPVRRLAFMIDDAGLAVLLTQSHLDGRWPSTLSGRTVLLDDEAEFSGKPSVNLPSVNSETDLAYVIYTSGSTGQPKGVAIPRAALGAFMSAMKVSPGIAANDVLVAVTTLSFDIAGLELLLPLATGARVVIATKDETADGAGLARLLHATGATVMQGTPATWRLLLSAGWRPSAGLKMLCGGEPLTPELIRELLVDGAELWNMYGPTETTVWSSVDRIAGAELPVSVGRPIRNTTMWVLDRWGQPLPAGIPGELCIGGAGLAREYWRRPELTAERFVPDPFSSGGRLYRTGDLARFLPDGRLQCLGRVDHQVKLRGFRIELGEVEAALHRHPAVKQALAVVQSDAAGDRRLVAYLVPLAGEQEPTASDMRRFMRQEVPDYMIPSLFVTLDSLPLTANGKLDRRALPNPFSGGRRSSERVAPRTPTEQAVAAIWQRVLGRPDISVHDNFFDVGGHSLLSMEAIAAIERELAVRLNPAQFMMDTLEQISASCDQIRTGVPASAST